VQLCREIERFLIARRQEGSSPATIKQYDWHLTKMAAWLSTEKGIDQVEPVDRDVLREWGAGLRDQWSPATIKSAICACRAFFRWLRDEGVLDKNPALALKVPRVPKRVQRTITVDELRAMLQVCDENTIKGRRDCALLNVLIDTGLRAAEVCRLRLADVDLERCEIVVVVKGGNQDLAHFGASTARAIEGWLEVRTAAPGVETLFTSVGGGTPGMPLTTRGLRIIVKRIGDKAGVEGVSPHAFRRGFACIATEAGAPSRVVQLAGRWSDIRMVERYTAALRRGGLHRQWSPADRVNGEHDEP
jgi:site-specific recombinase XerD